MWTLKELVKSANERHVEINSKWVPARPINWKYRSFFERVKEAWAVFKGKADCFRWPENQ